MITVVAIATTVHIIVEFRRRLNDGEAPQQALTNTLRTLSGPLLVQLLLISSAFGSLIASNVGPVHDFGIMTVFGAAMVLVAVGLVIPWFALVGQNSTTNRDRQGEEHLDTYLNHLVYRITQHPKPILFCSLAIIAFAGVGLFQLQVEQTSQRTFGQQALLSSLMTWLNLDSEVRVFGYFNSS